ncbi:MAG: PAS domain S-box protein [Ilumatobacter sp.]|uniref:sensor histidine kinase n=1 Tax=Ilumatobacter sp. TaxID=1967498 RepID=UPI00261E6FDF|nr:PAS domain S-box protein [Ilumatobacter sp.]MDJ0770316.1 PAS domain S-box protein [Ilumatobacter sp.]
MVAPPDPSLLLHAVESAPDGVLVVDRDGTIVYANRAMHDLADVDELVGTSVDQLVPGAARDRHADLRAMYNGAPSLRPMGVGLELAMQCAEGKTLPVEVSLSPIQFGQYYVVATVRDLSERLDNQQRLATAHEQLALVHERERIGRDLHDVVLQHLYGMGLTVQATASLADELIQKRLEDVIDDIDGIISEVRTIVFTLGTSGQRGALGQELADVVAQASRVLGFTPSLRMDGPVESALTDEIRTEMVASMREALGNVARHAKASKAQVRVEIFGGDVVMTVVDNGIGPDEDEMALRRGHGLANLENRASKFGGSCTLRSRSDVEPGDVSGAVLRWSVPF